MAGGKKKPGAAMVFGRCFEKALGAYFSQEDSAAVLFKEWELTAMLGLNTAKESPGIKSSTKESIYSKHLHGIVASGFTDHRRTFKSKCCGYCRAEVSSFPILMPSGIDDQHCLIDWKTTTSRYTSEPEGLLSLDPQLICYSWISGISEVALVVFVRKHAPEIQYLRATISEEQRQEFGRLVETTIGQIEAAQFVSHSGIRFPQNGCLSCPHLGLCLNNQLLIDTNLVRTAGASDLDWLEELMD